MVEFGTDLSITYVMGDLSPMIVTWLDACDRPGPRASAELWRLATEWRLKRVRVLTGTLWELA
jgi:hypothetical protein